MRIPCLKMLRRLRDDDAGSVQAASLLLIVTIVGLGLIVGFTTLRDQVVQETADAALALDSLNQSYSFSVGTTSYVYEDTDDGDPLTVSVNEPANDEE